MTHDSLVAATVPSPKGHTFVPEGNRPIFSALSRPKPHVVLFGHSDALPQLRMLADMLRDRASVSSYVESSNGDAVPESYIIKAVEQAQLLIFGPSSASCNPRSEASRVEVSAIKRACRDGSEVPLVFAIGSSRQGLGAAHVNAYAKHARSIIVDMLDTTGGMLDIFSHAAALVIKGPEHALMLTPVLDLASSRTSSSI